MRRLLVFLAALGVVAGCSTSVAGSPSPDAAPAAPSAGADGLTLPQRPRELKLDGIDPCSTLMPSQLAKLGLDSTVPSISTDPSILEGKICAASGFGAKRIQISIAFILRPGIEYITRGPTASRGSFESAQVAGFHGVIEPEQEKTVCAIDLDVATGQFINITYSDAARPQVLSRTALCQGALSVGTEIMQSLQKN
jgi:hypothetical protein